jgi:hypothetical protein
MLKRKWLLGFISQIRMTKRANPNEFGHFIDSEGDRKGRPYDKRELYRGDPCGRPLKKYPPQYKPRSGGIF